jgi:hypothetical protein
MNDARTEDLFLKNPGTLQQRTVLYTVLRLGANAEILGHAIAVPSIDPKVFPNNWYVCSHFKLTSMREFKGLLGENGEASLAAILSSSC